MRWSVEALLPHVGFVSSSPRPTMPASAKLDGLSVRFITIPCGQQGTSIAAGAAALAPDTERGDLGSVIVSAPAPISSHRCSKRCDAMSAAIAAPVYRGVQGTPVASQRRSSTRLRALDGDAERARRAPRPRARQPARPDIDMPPDVVDGPRTTRGSDPEPAARS